MDNGQLTVDNEQLKEKRRVPELRFPEFSGEWEEKKLGEVLEFKNGINATAADYGKGIKFINVLDILNNDYITYESIIGKVNIEGDKLKENEVNFGDVVFQRSSETREEVGMSNIYLDEKPATFGGFVIRGKKIGKYNPIFLNYLLKTEVIRKQMEMLAGGSTRFNIGQKELKSVKYIKPNIKEQDKIGNFFFSIDKKLELQQERIAHLKEYKKGMMQRIFSQEIRFKDENGQDYPDWEEKKLGEVVKRKKGKVVEFTNNGEYPVIEIEYFNTGRIMNYTNTDNGVWCEEKDVLLLWDGSQSGNIFTNISGIVGSTIMRLRPINVNNVFLTLALKHDKLYIKSIREGSGIPHIPKDFLTHYVVNLPSLPEQQKIANFLSSIDKKIELEEEKLTKLKELKKGLMQRMFV